MPPKSKRSPRSRKTGPNKGGRPKGSGFSPTAEHRQLVENCAALGIPQEDMVLVIKNPETNQPISPVTLRRHFPTELRTGMVKAKIKGGTNLLRLTATSAAAAIFFAKVRLGMRERVELELPPGPTNQKQTDVVDTARRIAFVLAMGAHQMAVQPTKQKKREPA